MPVPTFITRESWDKEWRDCFERLRSKGYSPEGAQKLARQITSVRYGERPPAPPIWLRLAIRILGRRLKNVPTLEVKPMLQRFVISLSYGLAAGAPVFAAAFADGVVSGQEWSAIASAFVVAAWGKFSSNQTFLASDRPVWTPEERTAKLDQ